MLKTVLVTAFGIMLLILQSSCVSENPQNEVVTIDGVDIRLNYRPVRGDVPGEIIHPSEVLYINGLGPDYPEEAMILRPSDVIAGPNGEIIVLDDNLVKVFDSNGLFLRSFGGKGEGPGEFTNAVRLPPLRRKQIVIHDANPSTRISIYSPDGGFIRQLLLPVPGISGLAETRDDGFVLFRIKISGDIFESDRVHTLQRINSDGDLIPFLTKEGPLDSLIIASHHREYGEPIHRNITSTRPLLNTPDGSMIAVGKDYTFYRLDESGVISAFKRVAEVFRYPDWYLSELRERFEQSGREITQRGYWLEPASVAVDERGHLWASVFGEAAYSIASTIEELQNHSVLPLDEFDIKGRWLRQVVIQLPDSLGSLVLTDAAHGSLYGYIFPGPNMVTTPVFRFHRP